MRKIFKTLAGVFLIPLTRWYLRKERRYTYRQTTVSVLPGVFHPGLFASTRLILDYLDGKVLPGQTLLEIGSGTGLISVVAAKAKAKVTSLDISLTAVENTQINAKANSVQVTVLHSDLFSKLAKTTFDWVIINPPYYARKPQSESDFAWYCGESFEYFRNLFKGLSSYLHPATRTIMVLTEGCDLDEIFRIAKRESFALNLLLEKDAIFDGKDMLYEIVPITDRVVA